MEAAGGLLMKVGIPLSFSMLVAFQLAVGGELTVGECVVSHGNVFSDAKVQGIVSANLGANATEQDCIEAAGAVEHAFREAGAFAAHVYVEHDEQQHRTILRVLEGRLADNGLSLANSSARVDDAVILNMLDETLEPGSALQSHKYERAILLVNDLPGIKGSNNVLYPGQEVGEANFQLTSTDSSLAEGYVFADNFGSTYTGENRMGTTLDINSPLHMGDKFTLGLSATDGDTYFGFLDASIPVWLSGMRAGITLDALKYHTDESDNLQGRSRLGEAYLQYPVIRARQTNLHLELRAGRESMEDENRTSTVTDRVVDAVKIRLSGDHIDQFYGGGLNSFELEGVYGDLDLDGYKPYKEEDRLTAKTAGHFSRLTWRLARLQHLSGPWQSQLELAGQVASKRLDSSQSITFGGPFDFPGYAMGEVLGDEGTRLHWDVRYNMALPSLGGSSKFPCSTMSAASALMPSILSVG